MWFFSITAIGRNKKKRQPCNHRSGNADRVAVSSLLFSGDATGNRHGGQELKASSLAVRHCPATAITTCYEWPTAHTTATFPRRIVHYSTKGFLVTTGYVYRLYFTDNTRKPYSRDGGLWALLVSSVITQRWCLPPYLTPRLLGP